MASAPALRVPPDSPRRTLGTRTATLITIALLVVANLVDNRWAPAWGLVLM